MSFRIIPYHFILFHFVFVFGSLRIHVLCDAVIISSSFLCEFAVQRRRYTKGRGITDGEGHNGINILLSVSIVHE